MDSSSRGPNVSCGIDCDVKSMALSSQEVILCVLFPSFFLSLVQMILQCGGHVLDVGVPTILSENIDIVSIHVGTASDARYGGSLLIYECTYNKITSDGYLISFSEIYPLVMCICDLRPATCDLPLVSTFILTFDLHTYA